MGDSLVASGGNVTVRFEGQVASFDSLLSVNGGSGDDTILGGPGDDQLLGLGGDDQITGSTGADIADAGAGNDRIVAGVGNDIQLFGGAGKDVVNGGAGNDRCVATVDNVDGNDKAIGGPGHDTRYTDPGDIRIGFEASRPCLGG